MKTFTRMIHKGLETQKAMDLLNLPIDNFEVKIPVLPSGGEIYLYRAKTARDIDCWRKDGYRWCNRGTSVMTINRTPVLRKSFFYLITKEGQNNGFQKHVYRLFDNETKVVIHYLGDESLNNCGKNSNEDNKNKNNNHRFSLPRKPKSLVGYKPRQGQGPSAIQKTENSSKARGAKNLEIQEVCSNHFVDGCPTIMNPLPTLNIEPYPKDKERKKKASNIYKPYKSLLERSLFGKIHENYQEPAAAAPSQQSTSSPLQQQQQKKNLILKETVKRSSSKGLEQLQCVEDSRNEKLLKAMLYQMNPQNPQNITVPAALGKPMTLENRKVPLSTSSTSNSTLTPETIQIEDVPPPTKKPKEIQIEIDEDESNDASKSDLQSTLEPPTQKIITASSSSTSTSSSVPSAKSKPAQSVSVVNVLDVNRPQKQKRILVVPNHQQSVMSNLSSLWKAGRLCDAFISNGTVNVKVHKMILGAVCPKVLDVFYNTPQHKLPKVTFPSSVSKEALLAFAEYMYNGVLDLDFDLLNQMKVIAHRLDMKDFEQLCNNQINSSLVPNMMPTILEPMLSEPCSSSGLIQGLQTTVMERVQTSNRAHTKNGLHAVSSLSTVPSAASNSGISLSSLPLVEVRAETDDNLMEVNNELGGSGGAEDSRSSRVKIEKVDLDDQAYGGEAVSSEMNFSTSDSLTANNFAMPHFPNSDLSHSSSTSSQHTNNTFNKPVSVTHVWSKKNKERANVELGSLDPYPTGLYTIDWSNLPPSTQEIKQEYSID